MMERMNLHIIVSQITPEPHFCQWPPPPSPIFSDIALLRSHGASLRSKHIVMSATALRRRRRCAFFAFFLFGVVI